MRGVRSVGFIVAFYVMTAAMLVACLPMLLLPRRFAMQGLVLHGRCSFWLLRALMDIRVEVRGIAHIPLGASIVAAKHQSTWETFALFPLLPDAAMVMKAELGWIPLYGWFSIKCKHIFVERSRGPSALRQMISKAKDCAALGRQIVIFPEGTRQAVGAVPVYRSGVAALYGGLGVPCIPVALNSGVFWPRRQVLRPHGTIVVEFLEPIRPGLDRLTFLKTLERRIEAATLNLVNEVHHADLKSLASNQTLAEQK